MTKHKVTNQNVSKNSLLFTLFSFLFLAIFTLYSLLFTLPIHAQAPNASHVLRISPIIINIPLSPGKKFTHQITVENLTDTPLPLKANLNDFVTTGEEGGYTFVDKRTNPLLTWIKLSDDALILRPKEKRKITLNITTPKTIPLGGYYGLIFFEPLLKDTTPGNTNVISRIGVLMLANVGVPDPDAKKANILTFSTGLLHQDSNIPLLLRVENVSLHFFTAKPILTISPLLPFAGKPQQPIYLEEKLIFQGKVRRWEQELPTTIGPNIYKAHMAVSTGNGQTVNIERYFIIFPGLKTLVALLTVLLLFFIIRKRKRLKKALTELFAP